MASSLQVTWRAQTKNWASRRTHGLQTGVQKLLYDIVSTVTQGLPNITSGQYHRTSSRQGVYMDIDTKGFGLSGAIGETSCHIIVMVG